MEQHEDFWEKMVGLGAEFTKKSGFSLNMQSPDFNALGYNEFYQHYLTPGAVGGRKSTVPALGLILWVLEPDENNPFHAYIFARDNGQLFGYLRIPHYKNSATDIHFLATIISFMQRETAGLVIDQTNNSGGSMFQMYGVLSMLISESITAIPLHSLKISQEDVAIARDNLELAALGDDLPEEERPSDALISFSRFVINEFQAGRTTTGYTHLGGVQEIKPSAKAYNKSLVILINQGTFSAGEFFAAILQDNNRAKLYGKRTVGAGGCVKTFTNPNSPWQTLNLTWTLSIRPNGEYIENVGVLPDVESDISDPEYRSNLLALFD